MRKIILASTSPRRKDLLKKAGVNFAVHDSGYLEKHHRHMSSPELVLYLALGKALASAKKHNKAVIIAADTIVEFEAQILGKPKNQKDAERMLVRLSGKMNLIHTGYVILNSETQEIEKGVETAKVYFKKYSHKTIKNYIATGEPMDKAGAYAVQGKGRVLVKKIAGDKNSVIGLPTKTIKKILKKWKIA